MELNEAVEKLRGWSSSRFFLLILTFEIFKKFPTSRRNVFLYFALILNLRFRFKHTWAKPSFDGFCLLLDAFGKPFFMFLGHCPGFQKIPYLFARNLRVPGSILQLLASDGWGSVLDS